MRPNDAETKTSTLTVEGMTCGSCVAHVQRALRDVEGVSDVDVRLRERTVVVKHETSVTAAELVEALGGVGYESSAKP